MAVGGTHARIRTEDLFLTKWSSVPGEFDPILALPAISAETIYLREASCRCRFAP